MLKPNLPTVDELVEIIYDLSRSRAAEFPLEVRLNLLHGWRVYTGDPSYDQSHRGAWGTATLEPKMNLNYCRVVAESLIKQAEDDWYGRAADELEQERKKPLKLSGKMRTISTREESPVPSGYGDGFTISDLRDHHRAIVGEPEEGMTRLELLEALYGTDFDEHAYSQQ